MVLTDLVGMIREVPWGHMMHRGYWPSGTPFMAFLWAVPKGHPFYDPNEAGVLHVVPTRPLGFHDASKDSNRSYVYMVFLMGQFPSLRVKSEKAESYWVMNDTDLVAMKLVFGGREW